MRCPRERKGRKAREGRREYFSLSVVLVALVSFAAPTASQNDARPLVAQTFGRADGRAGSPEGLRYRDFETQSQNVRNESAKNENRKNENRKNENRKNENAERRTPNPERRVRVGIAKPSGGYSVVEMPIETYVARVLAGEAVRDSQPAALQALAITARTFARANRGRHRADGFDLCDQTHCQVLRNATAATERAAAATREQLLLHAGAPAIVYYSASCGGHTSAPSEVWPGHDDPSYLPSQQDDACERAPAWDAELRGADVVRALHAAGFRGSLRTMRILSHTPSGRVARLRLDGLTPDQTSGQDLRVAVGRTLGWQHIKSTAFELRKKGDVYQFSGHGSGHGVGLCVIGSAKLAERGASATQILARYFPGLEIASEHVGRLTASTAVAHRGPSTPSHAAPRETPAPDVSLSLPDEDEGDRAVIQQQVVRARDELARMLGVPPPAHVTLRFHPTTDDYERATGRPWFTSAAVVSGELHLLPLTTLRDRGIFERTLRHELVHILTDATLAARPAWVREGAAIYFAGGSPVASDQRQLPSFKPEPRPSCPSDNELQQPVSVGALANAYARARACFAKQMQNGRSWRDVR
jgi:SpoIID/LytB domain protein